MASGDATLFEESFTVMEYDQSKYDRVARIHCTSADSQTIMSLDINIELFPCVRGDSLHVVLTTTLALDGSKEEEKGWRDVGKGGDAPATIADLYDYVCHGKIYKFEETFDGNTINAYVSFGGLLMSLQGPVKKLTPLRVDNVYLLLFTATAGFCFLASFSHNTVANEEINRDEGAVGFKASRSKIRLDLIDVTQVESFSFAVAWLRNHIIGELKMVDPLAFRVNKVTLANMSLVCNVDVCDVSDELGILADNAIGKTGFLIGLSDDTLEGVLSGHQTARHGIVQHAGERRLVSSARGHPKTKTMRRSLVFNIGNHVNTVAHRTDQAHCCSLHAEQELSGASIDRPQLVSPTTEKGKRSILAPIISEGGDTAGAFLFCRFLE
ncbi:hypothetical protein HG531_000402 [Fusarium graminearum]|nr:hypothetical protein HG531_000402 [Fusarium graminearum]